MFDKTYLLIGGLTMAVLGLMFSLIQGFDFAGPCFASGGVLMWLWVACKEQSPVVNIKNSGFSPELQKQIEKTRKLGEELLAELKR